MDFDRGVLKIQRAISRRNDRVTPPFRNYTVRAHLRHNGATEWRGCKNGVLHAGSLLRRLHAGHLRSRHYRCPAESSANHGQYPIPCGIDLSAVRSRWGQRLGQKKAVGEKDNLCKKKILEILRFRGFLARREGFEPPAFWSVGCLGEKTEPFRLRFKLFTAVCWLDFPLFPSGTACSNPVLGQKWVKISSQAVFRTGRHISHGGNANGIIGVDVTLQIQLILQHRSQHLPSDSVPLHQNRYLRSDQR